MKIARDAGGPWLEFLTEIVGLTLTPSGEVLYFMPMSSDAEILKAFPAAAEYLSSIHLICRDYGHTANHRLAEWLGVSTSAVTQALGRLKKIGLVTQERYEHVFLTDEGRALALKVLKRHYLLEHLLVKTLDFPWDKSDEEAKVLQNQISDALAEHLDARLGYPQTCPHGNPLPGTPVEARLLAAPRLPQATAGQTVTLVRITEEGEGISEMLPFCQREGLRPGARITVQSVSPDGVTVRSGDRAAVQVPTVLAKHLCFDPSL
jgi:DtxR family Mn-dependent transcriptional regulator